MFRNLFEIKHKVAIPKVKRLVGRVEYNFGDVLDVVDPLVIDMTLPPLMVKSTVNASNDAYKLRRRELIEQYGGNVILLKPWEEAYEAKSNNELLKEVAKEFVNHIETRKYEDRFDGKQLTDTPYYGRLKELIGTK